MLLHTNLTFYSSENVVNEELTTIARMWGNVNSCILLVGIQVSKVREQYEGLSKTRNRSSTGLSFPLWDTYQKEMKSIHKYIKHIKEDTCAPMFPSALFTTAEMQVQARCPLMDGDTHIMHSYIPTMACFSYNEEHNFNICGKWVEVEVIM